MRLALTEGTPYGLSDYPVEEYFAFDGLGAALVDTDGRIEHESVVHVEPDFEASLRVADTAPPEGSDVATMADVRDLHDVPRGGVEGDGVHVAVTDSGIDATHPVFDGVDVRQVDVTGTGTDDQVGHGTAVSGQVVRLAPGVTLTMVKIFPDEGSTRSKYVLRAYEWLFRHADEVDVVNMSWGAQKDVATLNRLQNRLVRRGVRDVTAAGNTGGEGGSPATAERAFGIGACTEQGTMAPFSSYDPEQANPEVAAVGVHNRLARASSAALGSPLSERWTVASGTSFAAPEVAGMAARYLARNPEARPPVVKEDFAMHARDVPNEETDVHGVVDYRRTVGGCR